MYHVRQDTKLTKEIDDHMTPVDHGFTNLCCNLEFCNIIKYVYTYV